MVIIIMTVIAIVIIIINKILKDSFNGCIPDNNHNDESKLKLIQNTLNII
ncbi:unnamed protein product [Schistosoma mattheei]|uniref:Uncharacterized protein n=1 Tax=Schistosoma mattheei TaxID=31246 RepID=A0A183NPE6_9TREM|nr:unnamed protein product [Schistosoma mattheei]